MRYEDLPLKLRQQADEKIGKQQREKRQRDSVDRGSGLPLACTACGVEVDNPAIEKRMAEHQEATGHGRFEWRRAG